MQDTLAIVAWPRINWDITQAGKYQLFSNNLNTRANVWLMFIKKKFMPTHNDNTISMDKIMLLCRIMEEITMNVGELICEHIIACVNHPHGVRPFPHLIEQL